MDWNVESILRALRVDFESEGDGPSIVGNASPLERAGPADVSFCSAREGDAITQIMKSAAGVIICRKELRGKIHPGGENRQLLLFTDNPRLAFVRVFSFMHRGIKLQGISRSASIDKTAEVGKNCYVGHYSVIGPNCRIGENTLIHDRVSLVQNCIIGANCIVQSGCAIGSDGFAFERDESGKLIRFPHKGYVKIGDDVEISANCSIARGSLSDTIIGDGTKVDALAHIAHNVSVGRDCQLTAGTVIGGSTVIGDSCWTGLNSTIKNKIRLGNNVIVASGASVIHDVADGDIVAGVPAKSIKHKVSTDELFLMAGQRQTRAALSDSSTA